MTEVSRPTAEQLQRNKEAYTSALLDSGAIKFANQINQRYRLRNGGESWIYVDHGEMITQPHAFKSFIDVMVDKVTTDFDVTNTILIDAPSTASPHLVGAMAIRLQTRQGVVSPDIVMQAEKGTNRGVRLPQDVGSNSVIVIADDVLTSGKTAIQTAQKVREALKEDLGEELVKQIPIHLLVGMARNPEKAGETLKENGITVHWVLNYEEVIAHRWAVLTAEQKRGLLEELPKLLEMGLTL